MGAVSVPANHPSQSTLIIELTHRLSPVLIPPLQHKVLQVKDGLLILRSTHEPIPRVGAVVVWAIRHDAEWSFGGKAVEVLIDVD